MEKTPGLKEMFPKLVHDCLEDLNKSAKIPDFVSQEYEKLLEYIKPKMFSAFGAMLVPNFLKILKPTVSEDELELSKHLGWCYHLIESSGLIIDDFVDRGEYRYEVPTWTKIHNNNAGVLVYDSLLLQSTAYFLLRKNFKHLGSKYTDLLDLFLEVTHQSWKGYRWEVSQTFENSTADTFNWQSYRHIARLKFGWFFFYLPIASAMILSGIEKSDAKNDQLYSDVLTGCYHLAEYSVIVNDYNDSFARTKFDMMDTDIRQGQLTWMFLTAQESCQTDEQQNILKSQYGRDDEESVDAIKQLYIQLGLPKKCKQIIREEYSKVAAKIKELFPEKPEIAKVLKTYLDLATKVMDI